MSAAEEGVDTNPSLGRSSDPRDSALTCSYPISPSEDGVLGSLVFAAAVVTVYLKLNFVVPTFVFAALRLNASDAGPMDVMALL